jgi:hypothetical protein
MSGYLQRLVSTARTPDTAIRPVLGSLYSHSPYDGTAEGLHGVEETVVSRQPDVTATSSLVPPHGIPAPSKSRSPRRGDSNLEPRVTVREAAVSGSNNEAFQGIEESAHSGQPEGPKLSSETPASFTPLVAEAHGEQHAALVADFTSGPTIKPSEGDLRPLEGPSQQPIRQGPYAPLAPEGLRPAEAVLVRDSSSRSPDRGKIERTGPARHSAPVERFADDIQIHIGRIEVTAVPPAPTRPAVQPVRKSLRLDDYLRRGREGAR